MSSLNKPYPYLADSKLGQKVVALVQFPDHAGVEATITRIEHPTVRTLTLSQKNGKPVIRTKYPKSTLTLEWEQPTGETFVDDLPWPEYKRWIARKWIREV